MEKVRVQDGLTFKKALWRKAYRMVGLTFPIIYVYHEKIPMCITMGLFAAGAVLLEWLRFRNTALNRALRKIYNPIGKESEAFRLSGTTYFFIATALIFVIFPKYIAIFATVYMLVGDAAATLVGRGIGRIQLVGTRTLEGTTAFVVSCGLTGLLFSSALGQQAMQPVSAGQIWCGALVGGLTEAMHSRLNDNLTVGLITGFTLWLTGT